MPTCDHTETVSSYSHMKKYSFWSTLGRPDSKHDGVLVWKPTTEVPNLQASSQIFEAHLSCLPWYLVQCAVYHDLIMVSYFQLLEKESLCPSCQHFDAINSSLKTLLPTSISVAPQELLEPRPDGRKANGRWFRSAKLLVHSLSNCSSVKMCSRAWSFPGHSF